MISILIGNDTYAIEREVEKFKTQTHPLWRDFNIYRRNASLNPLLSLSGRGKIEIRDIEVLKN
jgi:hypothetical protein